MPNNHQAAQTRTSNPLQGLVVSTDTTLVGAIVEDVCSLCQVAGKGASPETAMHAINCDNIHVLFAHLDTENEADCMAMVQQVRRTHPEIWVFLIAAEKNPDFILQGLRLGVEDFIVPDSSKSGLFLAALQKTMGQGETGSMNGFMYSLFSMKGGQGVTSVSVNLADQLQDLVGGRILLLDLNLYMSGLNSVLNCNHPFTPYELIQHLSRMDENLLLSSLYQHPRGFYVLPAPLEVSDAERVNRNQITSMLRLLKCYFTHIIIDLPHDFTERTLATVEESDRVLIVMEPDLISVKSVQQILHFFQELNYTDEKIALLLNRQDRKSVLQAEDIEMALKQSLLAAISNDWKALTQAVRKGELLSSAHQGHRITRDIRKVASRLTGFAGEGSKQNVLYRLFKKAS